MAWKLFFNAMENPRTGHPPERGLRLPLTHDGSPAQPSSSGRASSAISAFMYTF